MSTLIEEDYDSGSEKSDLSDEADPWINHVHAWNTMKKNLAKQRNGQPMDVVFFKSLLIAKDGGISEANENLWRPTRIIGGLQIIGFCIINTVFVLKADIQVLFCTPVGDATNSDICPYLGSFAHNFNHEGKRFSVTGFLLQLLGLDNIGGYLVTADRLIAFAEMAIFVGILCRAIYRLGQMAMSKAESMIRWRATSILFFDIIPSVQVFSAMKLLYWANPQVIAIDVNQVIGGDAKGGELAKQLVWFVLSRIVCCVVGFDTYLSKFRATQQFIDQFDFTIHWFTGAFAFLNQLLGVVQLAWVIKDRLFKYVFTGEDGLMNHEEHIRKDTWNALIAERIWNKQKLFHQKLIMLLTLNDADFQRLTLSNIASVEEDEDETKKTA